MITESFLEDCKKVAEEESERTGIPSKGHIEVANEAGQRLAGLLGADGRIVLAGTLLMDAWLGEAKAKGIQPAHAEYCAKRAGELLARHPEVSDSERENILSCIREHHGREKFHSKEAEACCNADCYRFLSTRGVLAGIKGFREMPAPEMAKLFLAKADEKWNALSVPECKTELESQYRAIKGFFSELRE